MKLFSFPSVALLAIAPLAAQGSLMPYFPKDTMMAMSVPDLPMSAADFAKMPLAKMWAEEDVQKFFADVIDMAKKKFAEGMTEAKQAHEQGMLPVDPDQILKLRIHGGAFAVTKMQFAMAGNQPKVTAGMLLHLDFGDSAATWNQLLQQGFGMLEQAAGNEITKQETAVGDIKIRSYLPPAEAGIDMGLHIAMLPRGILIGTLASDVSETIAALNGKSPVLGATSQYKAAAAHLDGKGAECEMFVRPDPMIDMALSVGRMLAPRSRVKIDMDGVERAIKAMGLRNLGSTGMTSSYVDGKCTTRSFHVADASPTTAAVKTVDTTFLKWVPKEAVSFSATTLDAMSIYETIERGLHAYDPEFAKKALEQLAKMEEKLGFSVRNDFFGAFGDHMISWSMPIGTISSAPEVAMLLKVTDETKLVKVLKNLAKLTNGMVEVEEGEKRGVMVYQVKINFDPMHGMGGINPFDMFTPTFAFKQGYLVAGFSPSDVKRVFARMDRKEDEPKGDIRGNKEFAVVAASIPTGLTSVSFTDWKSNFESLYQVATGLLAFVPMGDQVPIDFSLLPESSTLTKHLFASVGWSKTDGQGTETVNVSPFGPEVMIGLGLAIGIGAGVVASVARDR